MGAFTDSEFMGIELFEVLRDSIAHRGVVGLVRLNDDGSLVLTSPNAPNCLSEKLKNTF
jgi:hypothetical protein